MIITSERMNDVLVVTVHEDINFENTKDLKNYIQKYMDEEHIGNYIIDLEHVGFIDSSGLGTLVSLLTMLKKRNGGLKLTGINENIEELFKLTRLNDFFDIYDHTELALEALKKA